MSSTPGHNRTVRLVTLGCARNEVDSEELAARLEAAGWRVTGDGGEEDDDGAGVVLVNTCGFIQAAKEESIGELLTAAESGRPVVAAGCLAERYGAELADALPEAEVISFDDYTAIADRLDGVLAGERRPAHLPRDRRRLLPLAPADRPGAARGPGAAYVPGHGTVPGPASPPGSGDGAPPDRAVAAVSRTAAATGLQSRPPAAPSGEPAYPGSGLLAGTSGSGRVPRRGGRSGSRAGPPAGEVAHRVSRSGSASPPPSGPRVLRRRLSGGLAAPLKIASGCDRRCSFCAIPFFRGAFVSREPAGILAEARWLAAQGVRELLLVSENSTSYGKDLGNLRLLEELLPALATVPGIAWVRVSYLQPAEMRPTLAEVMAGTPGVVPYFDLSFQHASGRVLRAMRRFGDRERFGHLLDQIRGLHPSAGLRSNFIVGFPGETTDDLAELHAFLETARLDAIGIFGYSDEDRTTAAALAGKLAADEIAERHRELANLAEELMAQRAEERIGDEVQVLLEARLPGGGFEGRAAHQGPEVDGSTIVTGDLDAKPGDLVRATVRAAHGVDLVAVATEVLSAAAIPVPGVGAR